MKISVCPSTLRPGYDTYSKEALSSLFEGKTVSPYIDIDFESESDRSKVRKNMDNISISGAQEKFSAVVDDGILRLSENSDQGTYILKPAPFNYSLSTRKQIPANEHLTMQIASQVYHIETARNGLCFSKSDQPVYITKRFDVNPDGTKSPMEDFASVLEMTEQDNGSNFKYEGSYEQIAVAIREKVPSWMIELEKFFKILVFCYMYANEDAHMKNFSLIRRDGELFLSPAYDLINTRIHIDGDSDLGLKGGLSANIAKTDSYERTGHPNRHDFEMFAEQIGLPSSRTEKILDLFETIPQEAYTLIDHSFLNDKMKRSYKRIIEERKMRYIRVDKLNIDNATTNELKEQTVSYAIQHMIGEGDNSDLRWLRGSFTKLRDEYLKIDANVDRRSVIKAIKAMCADQLDLQQTGRLENVLKKLWTAKS